MDRFLSPSETARRLGVTVKALRLYERHGLIAPVRSGAGWRTYGPVQIARLVQILALKRLGLPLARIAELLAGPDDLDAVLALQERALTRDSEKLSRALALVRDARRQLASGAALSIDDLATLTKETVMIQPNAKELSKTLRPFTDRHISAEEKAAMQAKVGDREQIAKDWHDLVVQWQALLQTGDPTSPAAQDMARRWRAFLERLPHNEFREKEKAILKDAMANPETAEKLAPYQKIGAFAEQAIAYLKAREAQ